MHICLYPQLVCLTFGVCLIIRQQKIISVRKSHFWWQSINVGHKDKQVDTVRDLNRERKCQIPLAPLPILFTVSTVEGNERRPSLGEIPSSREGDDPTGQSMVRMDIEIRQCQRCPLGRQTSHNWPNLSPFLKLY